MSITSIEFRYSCFLKDLIPTDFMRGVLISLFLAHASKSSYDMFFSTQFSMKKYWFLPDVIVNNIPVHHINTIKSKNYNFKYNLPGSLKFCAFFQFLKSIYLLRSIFLCFLDQIKCRLLKQEELIKIFSYSPLYKVQKSK